MKKVINYLNLVNRHCIVGVILLGLIARGGCHEKVPFKRDTVAATGTQADDTAPDYEEYPMVVPKRTAMFLDRLMVALHNALEDNDDKGVERLVALYRSSNRPGLNEIPRYDKGMIQQHKVGRENQLGIYEIPVVEAVNPNGYIERHSPGEMMELQRRGNDDGLAGNKGRKYWRCYFNAVTCF